MKIIEIKTDKNIFRFDYIKDRIKYFKFLKNYFNENPTSSYIEMRLIDV